MGVATFFERLPGAVVTDIGGWAVTAVPGRHDHPWLQQVAARGPVDAADLDAALALAGPTASVRVPDRAVPDEALTARGLTVPVRLLRLVAPAGATAVQHDWRLETVGREAADEVAALSAAAFEQPRSDWWAAPLGHPEWRQVVAYDGDLPVATGALRVTGTVGWVGAAGTLASHRGRGLQAALLAERLRLAAELGATEVVSKAAAGSGSERNLRRAGFRAAYDVVHWHSGPAGGR